jgi:hypothetical protein
MLATRHLRSVVALTGPRLKLARSFQEVGNLSPQHPHVSQPRMGDPPGVRHKEVFSSNGGVELEPLILVMMAPQTWKWGSSTALLVRSCSSRVLFEG